MNEDTEALEALLKSRGWSLFVDYVKAEWAGAGYARKIKDAVSLARTHREDASAAVDKVDYANDQIGVVIGWPKQEYARLKRQEQNETEDMRRPLDPALVSQTRRGSL